MSADDIRAIIVGPGAIGSLFAFYLNASGISVALAGRNTHSSPQTAPESIRIETGGSKSKKVEIERVIGHRESGRSNPDYLIFAVKAYDTEKAARQWKFLVGPKTYVVSLQNGLGNLDILARFFDKHKLITAVTSEASFLLSPGKVRHTARGITKVAPLIKSSLPVAKRFAQILQGAGLKSVAKNNARDVLWGKLVANSAINPLSAITGLSNGRLLSSIILRKLLSEIATETYTIGQEVAHASPDIEGVIDASTYVLETAKATARNKSSMLQDLLRGKRTEIDFINGVIWRIAKKKRISDTTLNEAMYHIIKALESNNSKSQHAMFC